MTSLILPRRLSFRNASGETEFLDQTALLQRAEPLVILGEAGMGKSTLLGELDGEDTRLVQARRLAASRDPRPLLGNGRVLIVDALDEAIGVQEGEAVDRVLGRLSELGNPQFILACRVADWRSATGQRAIADVYGQPPLELHLEPLDADDARHILANRFGAARAAEIVAHFEDLGLANLFGNPQTLNLIEAAASKGPLPGTRAGLFEAAVDAMWSEHSDFKQDSAITKLGKAAVLDAAGAAFATLILSGREALSRAPHPKVAPEDLPIAEIAEAHVFDVLESRLFRSLGSDRFTYAHRSIGEYLGARWLARRADTDRKRRRMLAMIDSRGLVPANLRGLHAWLARDPSLAAQAIARDSMGIIEYGDADSLDPSQGRLLLNALIALESRNPRLHRWGRYRAASLVASYHETRVNDLLADEATGFGVKILLLEAMTNSPNGAYQPVLRQLLLDPHKYYAVRALAGKALAKLGTAVEGWEEMLETLRCEATEDSLRLAVELLPTVGFDRISDRQIAEIVAARAGLTLCPVPKGEERTFAGTFYTLERELPNGRLDGVLNELAAFAYALLRRDDGYLDRADITDVIFSLAARRVALPGLDPLRLWHWLAPFEGLSGYHRTPVEVLSEWIKANPDARRAIQRYVLLERQSDKDLWSRHWRLERVVPGLAPDESDVVALLPLLGMPSHPSEEEVERWKTLVRLVPHDAERGTAVREAALCFAGKRKRLQAWVAKLTEPNIPAWQIRQEKRREKQARERDARWEGHRASFVKDEAKVRAGEFAHILSPAQAYLKLFSDIGQNIPAHHRIEEWLGPDLQDAAFAGFEAFLAQEQPKPDAKELAESHAQSRRWNAEYVIIAALAERWRTGRGFADLPDERLLAGALILRATDIHRHAQIEGLAEAIDAELKARDGQWEAYWRLQIEPHFETRRLHVQGLYALMREQADAPLAARLAIEWLGAFPDLPAEPEAVMIDRLIASRERDALRELSIARHAQGIQDDDRRRNWDAVSFLTDFDAAKSRLDGAGTRDAPLLWHLRRRLSDEHDEAKAKPGLRPNQIAWIVREFREAWPVAHRPSSVTTGDTNIWDATEFIRRMIARLGDDSSDEAVRELAVLRESPADGYTEALAIVAAEQAQKRAEQQFIAPTPEQVMAVLTDQPPASIDDLRAVVVEELDTLARRFAGSETDTWRRFWDAREPLSENDARDLFVDLLGPNLPFGIVAATEVDMPNGKRADIGFSSGQLRLPVEVKRQWHADLWHAADTQLDRLYGTDHRATGIGVYLVLWFGEVAGRKMPKRPSGRAEPKTTEELRLALIEESDAARSGRVAVVVVDVSKRTV
jgi:hypothetical protein